jgi:hypothetical protein
MPSRVRRRAGLAVQQAIDRCVESANTLGHAFADGGLSGDDAALAEAFADPLG